MSGSRYALYAVPPRDHPLTAAATAWLGRDAWTGDAVADGRPDRLDGVPDLTAATAFPRHYGFHATLKAPFALADGRTEQALLAEAAAFAASETPPPPVRLAPAVLGAFVGLVATEPAPALQRLADATVAHFEPFRAPLESADRDRRLAAGLSDRQRDHLGRWGYPYVFEDFLFHMTVAGPLSETELREGCRDGFAEHAAAPLADPLAGLMLALFRQPERGCPFTIIAAWPLGPGERS